MPELSEYYNNKEEYILSEVRFLVLIKNRIKKLLSRRDSHKVKNYVTRCMYSTYVICRFCISKFTIRTHLMNRKIALRNFEIFLCMGKLRNCEICCTSAIYY